MAQESDRGTLGFAEFACMTDLVANCYGERLDQSNVLDTNLHMLRGLLPRVLLKRCIGSNGAWAFEMNGFIIWWCSYPEPGRRVACRRRGLQEAWPAGGGAPGRRGPGGEGGGGSAASRSLGPVSLSSSLRGHLSRCPIIFPAFPYSHVFQFTTRRLPATGLHRSSF